MKHRLTFLIISALLSSPSPAGEYKKTLIVGPVFFVMKRTGGAEKQLWDINLKYCRRFTDSSPGFVVSFIHPGPVSQTYQSLQVGPTYRF